MDFLGGCTGGVWGVGGNGDIALRKEPSKENQRKRKPLKPVNGFNDKESYGHGEGQSTECR